MAYRKAILPAALALIYCSPGALAAAPAMPWPDTGKLIATGGVSQLEGAGGGLTPWALITGYGSGDSYGGNAHATQVSTQDYMLKTYGLALGMADRLELSIARQEFSGSKAPLHQLAIRQDILGIKLRLSGDAVFDQDRLMPQIAVGAMFKRNSGIGGLAALEVTGVRQLGAADERGATTIWPPPSSTWSTACC